MRTLTPTAQSLVDAVYKQVSWLFEINNQYLNFDASTGTFTAGDTITGATSGATATIDRVVYSSTTAGKLMLSSVSGTFQDDEIIYVASYGDELVDNGDFANWTTDTPDDWTVYGEVGNDPEVSEVGTGEGHGGVGSGMCNIYTTDDLVYIRQADVMVEDKYYKVDITIDTVNAGEIVFISLKVGGAYPTYSTTGSKSFIGIAAETPFRIKRKTFAPRNTDVTFDNVSVKQITNAALANGTLKGSQYYWSTKTWTDTTGGLYFDSDRLYFDADTLEFGSGSDSGQEYTFKVIPESFSGITLNSPLSQYGTYAPNELEFEITNSGDTLTASDFDDATVYLKLVLSDGSNTAVICDYKYVVDRAKPYYQKIAFSCKDFLAAFINSDYPNTPISNDIFDPGTGDLGSTNEDPFCVPVPFGTCYIPLKCITDSGYARGYLLGSADYTYTITEVSSPRSFDAAQSWSSDDADFRQVEKTDRFTPSSDYKILHPFIIKMDDNNYSGTHTGSNNAATLTDSSASWTVDELIGLRVVNETDGSAGYITDNDATTITATLTGGTDNDWDTNDEYYITASGLWKQNGVYQSILAKFSRNDTSALTGPEEVIEYVFEDNGVGTDFIDTGVGSTFETAGTTYTGWGLTFNGAYFYKRRFAKVIAELLTCCHSTIDVEDKIKLRVLSKTSQKTIDNSDIISNSFKFSYLTKEQNDSGYVAFHESGEPQDIFIKLLLAAKSTTNNQSSEVVNIPFVQDSEMVQKLGQLHYQRKFGKDTNISFTGKSTLLALQPNDVITINHSNYGASFTAVIESIIINRDVSVKIRCVKYKYDLDDWADLGYGTVSLTTDNATYWSPTIGGPDSVTPTSGNVPHVVPGKLRIGATGSYILIDDVQKSIKSSNYISGYAGTGFYLDPDLLEVGNIACRGIFRSAVVQYDNIFAYGGNKLVVKGADVLATDMTAADNSTVEIENDSSASAWSVGDILRMKDANDDEWFEIDSVDGNTYTCTRDKKSEYGSGANPAWTAGQAVINYGQSGDGGILMTASETNAPYMSIFTHAGSPWDTITTYLRLGNLNGFLGYASDKYGIAIGETNKSLKYDSTNGLVITGPGITAGSIQSSDWAAAVGVKLDLDNKYLKMGGSNVTAAGGAAGIFLGLDTSYKFYVGDGSNEYFSYNGSNVSFASANSNAIIIKSGGDLTVEQGGDIIMEGGASGNPSLIRFTDETVSGEIRFEQTGDSDKYWSIRKGATSDVLFITPSVDLNGSAGLYIGYDGSSTTDVVNISALTGVVIKGGGYLRTDASTKFGVCTAPTITFDAKADIASYVGRFWNDGNNSNRAGLIIQSGADNGMGTNYPIVCADGDGDTVGWGVNVDNTFTWAGISDAKLKYDIVDSDIDGISIITQLKVRDFKWKKNDCSGRGFVAQEVELIYPKAIVPIPDDKGSPHKTLKGISKTEFIPVIVRSIQELTDRIIALERR